MRDLDDAIRQMDFDFFGRGRHKTTPRELLDDADGVLVDLRADEERAVLAVAPVGIRCLHLPLHELPERYAEIPRDRNVGLFCSSDNRSAIAFAYLAARGFGAARIVAGGYAALVEELKPGKVLARRSARSGE